MNNHSLASSPKIYRVFQAFFAVLLVVVIIAALLNNNAIYAYSPLKAVLCAVVGVGFALGGWLLVQKVPQKWVTAEALVMVVLFILFIAVQLFLGWQLRVLPGVNWDFGQVYSQAEAFVLRGTLPGDYFLLYANNKSLYVMWCAFFSLLKRFGVTNFLLPSMVLNILAIDLALLLLWLCARRLFGKRAGLFSLLLGFSFVPFVLYVPIFYTDTLTLPFPIAVAYLWLIARQKYQAGLYKKATGGFILLSFVAALGSSLKITVLILWLAVMLDVMIGLKGKWRWLMLGCGALVVFGTIGASQLLLFLLPVFPRYNASGGIPYTHWIMMGLKGCGGYNDADYQLMLQQPNLPARKIFAAQEIGKRLKEFGPRGLVAHWFQKLGFTFGDGMYNAPIKLDQQPIQPGFFHNFVVASGPHYKYLAYYSILPHAAMLGFATIGSALAARRKGSNLAFLGVGLFGLIVFLLLWETRSRYLVNYLPIFILCAVQGLQLLTGYRTNNKGKTVNGMP
ncbi:glycosyltransferase family 39 protein [Ruminococcaceae bacterium OttesenSCG-928-A16]|nr:glycosyltransferase family 39 protein [Ruminococcaceae bacterium OttesenSCG-928-A16]